VSGAQGKASVDGRRARGERARAAVAEALISLFTEGDLNPPAPRIAERAGVSLRLLYHHFDDMEALWDEVGRLQMARLMDHIRPIPRDLPVAERVAALVGQRAVLYELMTPLRRAALLHEPTSQLIATRLRLVRSVKRVQVVEVFGAELQALPAEEREEVQAALCAAASWSTWEALRAPGHQGLAVEQAAAAMRRMLRRLLAG
jgi:AcrR family transcriptional regulator